MKITCQACAAKYTIADEKVRGKTVKIKCKKCGASIVASGKEGEGAPAAGGAPSEIFWTVNVGEGDQRSVSAAEVKDLVHGGHVNADTYAWRDGMADWLPLSEVPELASLFSGSRPPEASSTSTDFASREIDEDMPTKMERGASLLDMAAAVGPAAGVAASAGVFSSGPFGGGPTPFAPGPAVSPSPPVAARAARAASAVSGDLFAPKPLEAAAPAQPLRPGKIIDDEASGLIDIRNLSASLGTGRPERPAGPSKSSLDDVMGLGGGALFSPAPMMAPPDLNAPPPPPPPPPVAFGASGPVSAQPGMSGAFGAAPAPPAKKSPVVAILLGVIALLLVAGGAGAFMMSKKGDEKKADALTADTKTADPAKSAESAKPAESVAAAPTSTIPSTSPEGTPGEASATGKDEKRKDDDKKKVGDKSPDKADDKKKKEDEKRKEEEKKKEDDKKKEAEKKKEPEPPPATGGGSDAAFDRGAAMSAMGAAAGNVSACKKPDGPTGSGRVAVTFAPSGNVTNALVNGDPFAGTAVGGCVAAKFRSVKVPPFGGSPVTVNKTFTIN